MLRTLHIASLALFVGVGLFIGSSAVHAACNATALGPTAYGQSGAHVTALQECLLHAGYSIPAGATGYFGSQTQAAVTAFYAKALNLLDWDGRSVGPQGRAALAQGVDSTQTGGGGGTGMNIPTPPPICERDTLSQAQYGMSGYAVSTLQKCLISKGYPIPAGATGYYGDQTANAVRALYARALGRSDWNGRTLGAAGLGVLLNVTREDPSQEGATSFKRVTSAAELLKYVSEQSNTKNIEIGMGTPSVPTQSPAPPAAQANADSAGGVATRVSSTNVQVAGIDEPDIVKTDGTNIYIGGTQYYGIPRPVPMIGVDIPEAGATTISVMPGITSDAMPRYFKDTEKTKIVRAFPVTELALESEAIQERGEMLLLKDKQILVIFTPQTIVGYDVRDAKNPTKKWTVDIGERTQIVTSRLKNDTIYLVTSTWLDSTTPCPIYPLMRDGNGITVPCTDIWVPGQIEPVNTSWSVIALDGTTGNANNKLTFAGENNNVVISVFEDNVYLSYRSQTNRNEVILDFYENALSDVLDSATIERIRTIRSYDISSGSKLVEVQRALNAALAGKSADEQLRFQNESQNRLSTYLQTRARELDRTNIARIPLATLQIAATGDIPGHLLNQFSIDEYEGNVRVAVTVGERWLDNGETKNDVYVLDSNLRTVGKVQDLGLTEQIYAVRFLGDRGYLVTFRQIDPFYVLDLSTPTNPRVMGELKIPGYSAYLEPLAADRILGVGREGSQVKLSVFDVSNPARPLEKSKYTLAENWTEVEGNHHAFLRDDQHKVFFIPGGQGGYVFSYDGALSLKATVAGYSIKRAVYIDDYLYVIGEEDITVLDENTWKEVKTLTY